MLGVLPIMTSEEREVVRQILTVLDAMSIRVDNRIRDSIQLLKGHTMPYSTYNKIRTSLTEARTILSDIPHRKESLYKLLDEQAKGEHDSG